MVGTETLADDIREMLVPMPDGAAIMGWKDISQAMRYSVRQAQRVADEDPSFPLRHHGSRVYVLLSEFLAWWRQRATPNATA